MPRTVESIVENHRAATALRAAGKPIWPHSVNVQEILDIDKDNESVEHIVFVANRIAKRFRTKLPAKFFDVHHEDYSFDFEECIEVLEQLTVDALKQDMKVLKEPAIDIFNGWLADLYDQCDRYRIWTRG